MRGNIRTRTAEEIQFAKQLSEWIWKLRASVSFNPAQLADVASVASKTLVSWERGESMPSPFQLSLLRSFARKRGLEMPEL
jgi:DNA-binding transcriptional regulator YiaG